MSPAGPYPARERAFGRVSTRIRMSHHDRWAIGQLRATGRWEASDAALALPKGTSARLVALGLARVEPHPEPGQNYLIPVTLH